MKQGLSEKSLGPFFIRVIPSVYPWTIAGPACHPFAVSAALFSGYISQEFNNPL